MYLISIHSLAITLSNVIAKELNYDNTKKAQICYGLEAIIGFVIKSFIFLIVPYFFGVFKQSLTAMLTIAFLRYASGGKHCNTFLKCLILSTAVYISIGILSQIVTINDYLYCILNITSLLIIALRAPVDPPEKPIKTKRKRHIMKIISIIIALLLIYIASSYTQNDIKNSILLGIYYQTITLISLDKIIYKHINQLKLAIKEVN